MTSARCGGPASGALSGRRVVSPQNRDVQHRIGESDIQPRLRGELALVASSVPRAVNEILLLERQKAPVVEHEGLDIITVGAAPRELGLT